jgi:hypothetical protein
LEHRLERQEPVDAKDLGVLALARPGRDARPLVTVAGIWAVVIGAMLVVLAFGLLHPPKDVDKALARG